MNKRTVLIASTVMMVSWVSAGLAAPFNQPVPKQEFQQSGTATKPAPSATKSTPDNAQAPAKAVTKKAPVKKKAAATLNNNAVKMLQGELTQLNQNNLLFQQKTNARLLDLTNKNQMLEQQMSQLQQALTLLNQEVSTLSKTIGKPSSSVTGNTVQTAAGSVSKGKALTVWDEFQAWQKKMGPFASSLILVAGAMIVLLIGWALWPTKKTTPKTTSQNDTDDDDDTKQEYDYLGSNEGIPAKLNLAQAYIAMEDFDSAKQVIDDVMKNGSDEQRASAEALSKQIPKTA